MSDSPSSVPSTPLTPDVSIGSATNSCPASRPVISVVGEKFVPNGHSISKSITETFREKQDVTGYTWREVCQSTRDFYWHEFMKLYRWNIRDDAIIKLTWKKVASSMYTKKMYVWRRLPTRPQFIPEDVWDSWKEYCSSDKWLEKSRIASQNRCSETGGPGTGPSKHTGGSRSTVEHTIKLAIELRRPANSWDIFKKVHVKKDGTFMDIKPKRLSDEMEAAMAAAGISASSEDSQENNDVNRLYYDMVGGEKKRRVYGLGSQAMPMYKDCNSASSCNLHVPDHAVEERIKLLEEEMLCMRENQDRILQQRVEAEVQQRVQQEVSLLRQQSDEKFQSMEERWTSMMKGMVLSSSILGDPTLANKNSPNA